MKRVRSSGYGALLSSPQIRFAFGAGLLSRLGFVSTPFALILLVCCAISVLNML